MFVYSQISGEDWIRDMADETQQTPPATQTLPPPPPPVTPPAQPNYAQPGTLSAADGAALLAAINQIPERMVNGMREAFTPPVQPPPAPPAQETKKDDPVVTPSAEKPDSQPGGRDLSPRERFVKWWGA